MQTICKKCGNIMLDEILNYKIEKNNRELLIENIQGYICPKCGNKVLDKHGEKQLEKKILEDRLTFIRKENLQPILISNIKNIRINKKFSQSQLGIALKVTSQRLGAIERNDNTPTVLIGYQLADLLGVEPGEIYKLHYITNELYEKLINLKLVNIEETGEYRFIFVDKAKETRNKLNDIRKEINDLNMLKVQLRKQLKKNEITEDTFKNEIANIESKKKKLNKQRTATDKELRDIEKDLIVKQGSVIDRDDWEKLITIYKEAAKTIV